MSKQFKCKHGECAHSHPSFKSQNALKIHSSSPYLHKNCPEDCAVCQKGLRENKRKPNLDLLACRHTGTAKSCKDKKVFARCSSARAHERLPHSGCTDCPICQVKKPIVDMHEEEEPSIAGSSSTGSGRRTTPPPLSKHPLHSIKGSYKRRKKASSVSRQELQRRRKQVVHILPWIVGCSDLKETFGVLFKNSILREELKDYLRDETTIVSELNAEKPGIDSSLLLGLKDKLFISDQDWTYVARLFKLENGSIYKIKKLRKSINYRAGITSTSDYGVERSIVTILTEIFRKNPPKSADEPIKIKFAFDGCRMTKNIEQVIGVLSRLDQEKSKLRSPSNASQFVIYIGTETYSDYKRELKGIIPVLNAFLNGTQKINVDDLEYTVDPYLVVDMKSLCTILGLYNVFHPKSTYCCCWCNIIRKMMLNLKSDTKFRDIQDMKTKGAKAATMSDRYASKNEGIKAPPLFDFPLHRIIPCSLHMMMAITKKLFYLLVSDIVTVNGKREFLDLCEKKKLKLWKPKALEKKEYEITEIVKKSRFQRTQYLTIIENWEDFVNLIKTSKVGHYNEVKEIWALFTRLIVEATSYSPDPSIIECWDDLTKKFMLAFKKRYGTEDFTPYMHLFVAHVGYWLKEHGDIESFANYDIESKNAVNKTVVRHASDRFGGKKRPKNHVAKMQMEREFRNEQQLFIVPQPKEKAINNKRKKNRKKENETPNKRRRVGSKEKPNWATRIVAKAYLFGRTESGQCNTKAPDNACLVPVEVALNDEVFVSAAASYSCTYLVTLSGKIFNFGMLWANEHGKLDFNKQDGPLANKIAHQVYCGHYHAVGVFGEMRVKIRRSTLLANIQTAVTDTLHTDLALVTSHSRSAWA